LVHDYKKRQKGDGLKENKAAVGCEPQRKN